MKVRLYPACIFYSVYPTVQPRHIPFLAEMQPSQFLLSLLGGTASASLEATQTPPSNIPSYVTEYAPIIHLFSKDPYRPADISSQLVNTQPQVNFTPVANAPHPLTLNNLNQLSSTSSSQIFLTSLSDPTTSPRPQYLYGVTPNSSGKTENAISSTIITVDHGNGAVDAFYMYFYAFDYGGNYLDKKLNIGNHVGDWEHNMIRFVNGTPEAVWFSQHAGGQAFKYEALEKFEGGVRPVVYAANGTHANYALPGTHDHTIPGLNLPAGPIEDHADAGPIWDPTLSAYYYTFDPQSSKFTAYDNATTPVEWLYFKGNWGDEKYPKSDPRQECFLGVEALCKFSGGPTGPGDKDLDRKRVCPDSQDLCLVLDVLVAR